MLSPASKWRWILQLQCFLWKQIQVQIKLKCFSFFCSSHKQIRKQWEHRDNVLDKSVLVWQTGGGKSGNRIFALGKFKVYLSHSKVADVRVHDQLHSKTKGLARTIHDEQCSRKFHNFTGENQSVSELDAKLIESNLLIFFLIFSIC